jgi:uncharacterized protein (TIGR02246 family)
MKTLALAAALLATPALAQPPGPADEAALKALAAEADAAWNAGDAARMTAAYADNGSLRLGSAPAIEGQAAIRAQFETAFAARRSAMRHVTSVDRIELVRPDLAVSDAAVSIEQQQADGNWRPVRAFRNVSIASRGRHGWRLQTVRAVPVPLQD